MLLVRGRVNDLGLIMDVMEPLVKASSDVQA